MYYSCVLSGRLTCPFDFCAVGIFYYIFRRVGWQEPGKLYESIIQLLRFAKDMLMSEIDNVFPVLMNLLSDCYYWLGCWWKPIRRCPWWSRVRLTYLIMLYIYGWFTLWSLMKDLWCSQSSSTMYNCCCSWRKESGRQDIWKDGRTCCLTIFYCWSLKY